MTMKHGDGVAPGRGVRWVLRGTGALAIAALFSVALPHTAAAGDDFERGFKRELGAIAAHEAVGLGRHILSGVIAGPYGYRHSGYTGSHHPSRHYGRSYRHGYRGYDRHGYGRSYRSHRSYGRPRVVHEHHHYYQEPCYD